MEYKISDSSSKKIDEYFLIYAL